MQEKKGQKKRIQSQDLIGQSLHEKSNEQWRDSLKDKSGVKTVLTLRNNHLKQLNSKLGQLFSLIPYQYTTVDISDNDLDQMLVKPFYDVLTDLPIHVTKCVVSSSDLDKRPEAEQQQIFSAFSYLRRCVIVDGRGNKVDTDLTKKNKNAFLTACKTIIANTFQGLAGHPISMQPDLCKLIFGYLIAAKKETLNSLCPSQPRPVRRHALEQEKGNVEIRTEKKIAPLDNKQEDTVCSGCTVM